MIGSPNSQFVNSCPQLEREKCHDKLLRFVVAFLSPFFPLSSIAINHRQVIVLLLLLLDSVRSIDFTVPHCHHHHQRVTRAPQCCHYPMCGGFFGRKRATLTE